MCYIWKLSNCRFTQRSESSGFQPGRPAKVKEPIKFENEFDFEQANEEFKDFLSKFEVLFYYWRARALFDRKVYSFVFYIFVHFLNWSLEIMLSFLS